MKKKNRKIIVGILVFLLASLVFLIYHTNFIVYSNGLIGQRGEEICNNLYKGDNEGYSIYPKLRGLEKQVENELNFRIKKASLIGEYIGASWVDKEESAVYTCEIPSTFCGDYYCLDLKIKLETTYQEWTSWYKR